MSDLKSDKIEVENDAAEDAFERWIARGDAIGVFRNHDLGSFNCGHRIFLPLTPEEQGTVEISKTRAPDGPYGLGWRYLLDSVHTNIERFEFV